MRNRFPILAALMASALSLQAAEALVMVVHPSNPVKATNKAEAASLLRGDTLFLGGKKVTLILGKPSTKSLPAVTYGLLSTNPSGLLEKIKQAKMRGVAYDPVFADSSDEVESKVAANPSAVGILLQSEASGKGVRVVPIAD